MLKFLLLVSVAMVVTEGVMVGQDYSQLDGKSKCPSILKSYFFFANFLIRFTERGGNSGFYTTRFGRSDPAWRPRRAPSPRDQDALLNRIFLVRPTKRTPASNFLVRPTKRSPDSNDLIEDQVENLSAEVLNLRCNPSNYYDGDKDNYLLCQYSTVSGLG